MKAAIRIAKHYSLNVPKITNLFDEEVFTRLKKLIKLLEDCLVTIIRNHDLSVRFLHKVSFCIVVIIREYKSNFRQRTLETLLRSTSGDSIKFRVS